MADTSYEKLIFDRGGPIITITLDRPKIHNALDRLYGKLAMARAPGSRIRMRSAGVMEV